MEQKTARQRSLARKAGYSLLEIMIVIAIMALIATFVGPQLFKIFGSAQNKAATTQIRVLKTAMSAMYLDIGRYPTEAEGLSLLVQAPGEGVPNWSGSYLESELPNDPWGQPYRYYPAQGDEQPKIGTLGKDNKEGGSGENADIIM